MKRILVVEDDESERILYHDELVDAGYDVVLAAGGKEALNCLKDGKIDLVVLDIVMPEMDGLETLGEIIKSNRDVPIILHSAYPKYKESFMSWGAEAFIIKSSNLSNLKVKIQEILVGFDGV